MITIDEIKETLKQHNCERLLPSSSVGELSTAMEIINPGKINDLIEIGTHNGLSSLIFTDYAGRVFTFDIALRNSEFIWNLFGVRHKISSFVSSYPDNIDYEINYIRREWTDRNIPLNFNFAFIDGWHSYEATKHDFELVKFCGRVLFHDYLKCSDVKRFCDEIGAVHVNGINFAYWEDK